MIDNFDGDYRFLSNFYISPMKIDLGYLGTWSCQNVEEVYQASKAARRDQVIWVLQSASAGIAKRRGREIEKRDDWEQIKDGVMTMLVNEKFDQNPDLAEKLIATGDQELVEGNTWNDRYWGVCKGKGLNKLGKILMAKREILYDKNN